ncbi:hypothetical protein QVD17_07595 [Tagetes erecta]|uniref:DUF4057 domain-containing protein n=1 Tax=Tagetes erecta TaxID=13708 RepID=A0AAD8PD08_TARER|nr:hypothetical protein QVD17_07595 [Tagetes erecta]
MASKTPVKKSHTSSTSDLLTWSENSSTVTSAARSFARSHQPSDGISTVVFGGHVTDEEAESFNKRKPSPGYKLKETTGSRIFSISEDNNVEEADAANPTVINKPGVRMYQQTISGISHISFGEEESMPPNKAISEAKQRELSGTLDNESDSIMKRQFTNTKNKELSGTLDNESDPIMKRQFTNAKNKELSGTLDNESDSIMKKQFTNAKNKELSGHNIFAQPPEIQPRSSALRESISIGESAPNNTLKKIPCQKHTEVIGHNIFKGDEAQAPVLSEKLRSSAKLREMRGSDIFADGKAESRDYLGGARKPPGGESSISLV